MAKAKKKKKGTSRKKNKFEDLKKQLEQQQAKIDDSEEKIDTSESKEPTPNQEIQNMINNAKETSVKKVALKPVQEKNFAAKIQSYQKLFDAIRVECGKVVIGQADTVTGLIRAIIADGHVLVEGVPGIAKTLLIRTLAETMDCSFSRIQFTPDLLPTDIVGISTYQEGRGFYTLKGPIFSHFVLADEINRAPPKVQSALLEAMAEKQATIAKETFPVPLPFFAMATQNPIEHVGTYSLPEAQIDRFLFKLYMGYPTVDEEEEVLRTNLAVGKFEDFGVKHILNPESILEVQADAQKIFVDKKVERYLVRIVDATRNSKKYNVALGKYIEFGASPRGSIGLFVAARADAMVRGQSYVTPHNVKNVAYDVLRHRMLMTYEGQAEGIQPEQIISQILKRVPVP